MKMTTLECKIFGDFHGFQLVLIITGTTGSAFFYTRIQYSDTEQETDCPTGKEKWLEVKQVLLNTFIAYINTIIYAMQIKDFDRRITMCKR